MSNRSRIKLAYGVASVLILLVLVLSALLQRPRLPKAMAIVPSTATLQPFLT